MTAVTKCYPGPSAGGTEIVSRSGRRAGRYAGLFWTGRCGSSTRAWSSSVGRLAIETFLGKMRLAEAIGRSFELDERAWLPLPHPSGASTWLNRPHHPGAAQHGRSRCCGTAASVEGTAAGARKRRREGIDMKLLFIRRHTRVMAGEAEAGRTGDGHRGDERRRRCRARDRRCRGSSMVRLPGRCCTQRASCAGFRLRWPPWRATSLPS